MDSPNSPLFPEYPSSDDDLYYRGDLTPPTPPTSDYSESEGEKEEEAWWSEDSEYEKDTEDEMLERYGDPNEEIADDRIPEMWEESSDEESDQKEGHGVRGKQQGGG